MLTNNQFSKDTDGDREERCLHMQANIDSYANELGVTGVLLSWAQVCHDSWRNIWTTADVEYGEMNEAFQEFQLKFAEVLDYYQDTKDLLISLLDQYQKDDDIEIAYGIRNPTPKLRKPLVHAIDDIKQTNDRLVAAGDPRVLPEAVVTNLMALLDEVNTMFEGATKEKKESQQAFDSKHEASGLGTIYLKMIYNLAKLKWGNEDPRLFELGFVPKSAIWTENKPPHPAEFIYDETAGEFQWTPVVDVDNYEIDYRLTGASGDWTQLYKGAATSTADRPPDAGEYDFRIRSWKGDDSGAWSGALVVNFPEEALSAPGMLMYDQFRNDFSWQFVAGATGYELESVNKTTQETTTIATPNNQKRQELATGEYATKVRAVKATSEPTHSPWSSDVLFTVKPAPGQLKYNPGLKKLSWDAVAGATMYEVRKDGSFAPEYLGPDTEFTINLPAGQYQFRVRGGEDMANWWSEWSEILVVDV